MRFLVSALFLGACAGSVQLSPAQRMELIVRLDQSAAFAKQCGLGRSEMRVRFVAMPDGSIAEPIVIMGSKGTPEKAGCVLSALGSAKLSPHDRALIVRTERLLPTGKTVRTDDKLRADSSGLTPSHIERVIMEHEQTLQACQQKHTGVKGDVTVFFLIDAQGKVSDVLVESLINQADVDWCLLDVFHNLRFDKPADGGFIEVVWPAHIESGHLSHRSN